MLILAINTASSKTAIALLEREKCGVKILKEKSWPSQSNEAEKLMPETAKLFLKTKKHYDQLAEVVIIKGPGSFTGLRVGVTVANTIAHLTHAKLFAVSTFEYWHAISEFPVVIYAGSGGVYLSENVKQRPKMLNLDQALKLFKRLKVKSLCGDISTDQKKLFAEIKLGKPTKSFGKIMQKILMKKLKPQKIINPLYIKKPQITPSKNQQNLKWIN